MTHACQSGDLALVACLVESNPLPEGALDLGLFLKHAAGGHIAVARYLLDHGAQFWGAPAAAVNAKSTVEYSWHVNDPLYPLYRGRPVLP